MIELLQAQPWLLYTGVVALGLIVGSFLNVVIWRYPRRLMHGWKTECQLLLQPDAAEKISEAAEKQQPPGLVWPASHCPKCQTPIKGFDNIPIFSYLILGGRCRQCKQAIGWRYPLTEFITALAGLVIVLHFGLSIYSALLIFITWVLIALTGIDIDHQILPDQMTLPLLWLALIASVMGWSMVSPSEAIIGAAAGYLVLWFVFHAFRILTGKHGMGHGDFKLLAVFGALLGWQLLPAVILIASASGAIIGIIWLKLRQKGRETPIPFGPFLAIGGWAALLWGDKLMGLYF